MRINRMSLRIAACLLLTVLASQIRLAADGFDDFDDGTKDAARWGKDSAAGGSLTEKNGRLEFTCPLGVDRDSYRPWALTRMPWSTDWEVRIDVSNTTTLSLAGQINSFGLLLVSPRSSADKLYVELYASAFGGLPGHQGFESVLDGSGAPAGQANYPASVPTHGAVRMSFASATSVLTVSCDTDTGDGHQWVDFGTMGLAGAGGISGNADWGLSGSDQFTVYVYGYATGMAVASGELHGDDFSETGGVAPSGGPAPIPVGTFGFGFPTDNPLLTAIASITGSYSGVNAATGNRAFAIDVAQDESGKIAFMGTAEGIVDADGGPEVSGGTGTVTTVGGQPEVEVQGRFTGTRDGDDATFTGEAAGPVEIVDIGGGTEGFVGTGGYRATVAGVPVSEKNLPFEVDTPPGTADNLKKDWNLTLDIAVRNVNGRDVTMASAQLVLPNGDLIVFPERKVRYSAKKGYSLSFKRGTNVSVGPGTVDRKTSLAIRGLTFVPQDSAFLPTGGAVQYRFLGQRGTADLMDFRMP